MPHDFIKVVLGDIGVRALSAVAVERLVEVESPWPVVAEQGHKFLGPGHKSQKLKSNRSPKYYFTLL